MAISSFFNSFARSGPSSIFSSFFRPAPKPVARGYQSSSYRPAPVIKAPSRITSSLSSFRPSSSGLFGLGSSLKAPVRSSLLSGPIGFTAKNASRFIGSSRPTTTVSRSKASITKQPSFTSSVKKGVSSPFSSALSNIARAGSQFSMAGPFGMLGRSLSPKSPLSFDSKTISTLQNSRNNIGNNIGGALQAFSRPVGFSGSSIGNVLSAISGASPFSTSGGFGAGGLINKAGVGSGLGANLSGLVGGGLNSFSAPTASKPIGGQSVVPPANQGGPKLISVPGTHFMVDPATYNQDPIGSVFIKDPITGQITYATGQQSSDYADQIAQALANQSQSGVTPTGTPFQTTVGTPQTPTSSQGEEEKDPFSNIMDKFSQYKDMYEQGKGLFDQLGASFSGGGGGDSAPMMGAGDLQNMQNQLQGQGGAGPLDQAITDQLLKLLGANFNPLSEDEIAAILRDLEKSEQDELDFITDQYKNLRPGADIETDSAYRNDLSDVREKYARLKQEATAKGRRDVRSEFNDDMLKALSVATGQTQFTNESIANALSGRLNIQNAGNPLNSFSSVFPSTALINF